jgi:hypothetical protein
MIKILYIVLVSLLFAGCANVNNVKPSQPTKKVFQDENRYVIFGLEAERLEDYNSSAALFYATYEKTDKPEYLYRSLQGLLSAHNYDLLLSYATKYQSKYADNSMLKRYEILALVNLNRVQEAQSKALSLAELTKEPSDAILLSDIYVQEKDPQAGLAYLQKAYKRDYNEKILDRIATLLYVNLHKKQEAIDALEAHSKNYGCSKLICMKLAAIYGNEKNLDAMVATYVHLYSIEPSDEVAQNIIKLYTYQKNYSKMMLFLEDSHSDDELLLQLYIDSKLFDKASLLAKKLYKENFMPHYLAESAIYKYESMGKKIDKKSLDSVYKDLKEAVESDPNAVYLNYLGYLMIEHNIDIAKGVFYVQEALKLEKDSPYYLDSLAWGDYKLHKCKEAKTIMDQVVEKIGLTEPEINEHINAINKCIKEKHR